MMAGSLQAHEQSGLKKRRFWTPEEDEKLLSYMKERDHKSVRWTDVPNAAGLNRSRKSCWLRWTKYMRPGIKRGNFSQDEENSIMKLHSLIGNEWAKMAGVLDRRTDNEIKNYYNTRLKKKLSKKDIPSSSQTPLHEIGLISTDPAEDLPSQTRGFNYEAMENPTVYNNYAAHPGLGSLYGNATNEGSTPALMVSEENVLTPPAEEFSPWEAWLEEFPSGSDYNNYAAHPGLGSLYGNATNEGSTPALMVSEENVLTPPAEEFSPWEAWLEEFPSGSDW